MPVSRVLFCLQDTYLLVAQPKYTHSHSRILELYAWNKCLRACILAETSEFHSPRVNQLTPLASIGKENIDKNCRAKSNSEMGILILREIYKVETMLFSLNPPFYHSGLPVSTQLKSTPELILHTISIYTRLTQPLSPPSVTPKNVESCLKISNLQVYLTLPS